MNAPPGDLFRILVVTAHRERLSEFKAGITADSKVELLWADTGKSAIAEIRRRTAQAAVIDEELPDIPGLELVRRMLPINAMLPTAILSDMDHDVFHEASEGLGIAAQLPLRPKAEEAKYVLQQFKKLSGY
jgi:DNA-binding response OmpR family regulator